ncbi:HAD hydrolase-like protein [Candidatus Uhrbacteria bacterium]|nr:HAD hydrolase-like protein [Candidatus Uhrbacteria bacterium]
MKKQTIPICFDLDHTLLDTLQIRKDIFALAKPYGVKTVQLHQAHGGAIGSRFTPRKFVSRLGIAAYDQTELLRKIWVLLGATRRYYVYPRVPTLLARLAKNTPLYLVTHGDPYYQRVKLQQSGLAHYFSRVLVTPEITKEKMLRRLYAQSRGKILMIDDSRRVQQSAGGIGFPIIKVRKSYKDSMYFAKLYETVEKYQALLSSGSFPPNFAPKSH